MFGLLIKSIFNTLFLCYNGIGDYMKVGVDKNCVGVVNNYDYDFIYLFEDESLKELLDLNMHCVKYNKCDYVDINLTDYDINCIKKTSVNNKEWNVMPKQKYFKLAIIIPNYNFEHTIEKCLSSIAEQTYQNYEVIFVDDMSTDNSIKVASKFIDKLPSIKIIQLKQKRLNGGARNEAYLHISDDVDYVYYVDSDDWLNNETALERINKNLQGQPDVLFVGMEDFKNNRQKTCYIPDYKNKYEALEGWSGSCGKVIKKELATRQDCLYPEGTLKEDRNQHRRICIKMKTFKCLKEPVYVWNRENYKSTTTIREKTLWGTSTIRHYADTMQLFLEEKGKDIKTDIILKRAVERCKIEIQSGGDRQW